MFQDIAGDSVYRYSLPISTPGVFRGHLPVFMGSLPWACVTALWAIPADQDATAAHAPPLQPLRPVLELIRILCCCRVWVKRNRSNSLSLKFGRILLSLFYMMRVFVFS